MTTGDHTPRVSDLDPQVCCDGSYQPDPTVTGSRGDLKIRFGDDIEWDSDGFCCMIRNTLNLVDDKISRDRDAAGNAGAVRIVAGPYAPGNTTGQPVATSQQLIDFYESSGNTLAWCLSIEPNGAASAGRGLAIGDSQRKPVLFIDNTGKLGVATQAPAYTLDVNGDANITGSLTADSISCTHNLDVGGLLPIQCGTIPFTLSTVQGSDETLTKTITFSPPFKKSPQVLVWPQMTWPDFYVTVSVSDTPTTDSCIINVVYFATDPNRGTPGTKTFTCQWMAVCATPISPGSNTPDGKGTDPVVPKSLPAEPPS